MKLILASSSPRRKEILEKANISFVIDSIDVDETFFKESTPIDNVKRVSMLKAQAVFDKYPEDVVLGCDTIVLYDEVVYGKPKSEEDAYQMLEKFSGKTHQVISGVSILSKEEQYNFHVVTNVLFKTLSKEEIEEYIQSKEPFGKAGSYAIQGLGAKLIQSYEGELENVIGLPIAEILPILKKYGF